jgi:hypothetical protein
MLFNHVKNRMKRIGLLMLGLTPLLLVGCGKEAVIETTVFT